MKKQSSKRKKRILMILVIAAIIGLAVFFLLNRTKDESQEVMYKETTVKKGTLTSGVTESGSVDIGTITQDIEALEDIESTSLSSGSSDSSGSSGSAGSSSKGEMDGGSANSSGSSGSSSDTGLEVEEIYVATGTEVKVGDPILKLTADSVSEYKETLEDAKSSAELALKKAQLEAKSEKLSAQYSYNSNVANGSVAQSEYDTTIAQLQASVEEAQANVDASAAKIAEYQKKIQKGEKCSAALAEEQANYHSLLTKLQSAQNSQTTKSIEAKEKYEEAMLKYNNADSLYQIDTYDLNTEVDEAQDDLDDASEALTNFESLIGDGIIYAQYDGVIYSVGYEAGDTLSSSTDVAVYKDASEVTMTVSVSQEDISAVNVGDTVEIALTAYEDKTYEGQVKAVDTSASSGTATVSYDVTVVFTGDTEDVYQDMTGNVTFIAAQAKDVCYVSKKAVTTENHNTYVKVKREDGSVEQVQVTTGISDGINIEISDGVEEGDTVLIESQVKAE